MPKDSNRKNGIYKAIDGPAYLNKLFEKYNHPIK